MSKKMEFSKGVVSEYYNGKKPLSSNFIQKFEECYKISLDNFLLNEDSTIQSSENSIITEITLDKDFLKRKNEVAELVTFLNRNDKSLRKNDLFNLYFNKIEQTAVNDFKEKFLREINKENYTKQEVIHQILRNTDSKD